MQVKTNEKEEVIDLTPLVQKILGNQTKQSGLCNVFVAHTTCSITASDLDPGTDQDLLDYLREIVPSLEYRHPHDPAHVGDHLLSATIGPSLSVPFKNKKLILGTWQRIILIELDGPKNTRRRDNNRMSSNKNKSLHEYLISDVFQGIEGITSKTMFGGYGYYVGGKIFAIIIDGKLCFKVGEHNRKDFEQRGSKPFVYKMKNGREMAMSYWELPVDVMEDSEVLKEWINRAAARQK